MPQGLAQKLKAKYPGTYDDIPDDELEQKVLAKHPEYQDLVTKKTNNIQDPDAWRKGAVSDTPEKVSTFSKILSGLHEQGYDDPRNLALSTLTGGANSAASVISRGVRTLPFVSKLLKGAEAGVGLGMASQGVYQGIKDPEHRGENFTQAALGVLGAKGLLPKKKINPIVPEVTPIESTPKAKVPLELTARPERLGLPARGMSTDIPEISNPRFYQGRSGTVDALDKPMIDWQDYAKTSKPGTLLPNEYGEIVPAMLEQLAEHGTTFGHGQGRPISPEIQAFDALIPNRYKPEDIQRLSPVRSGSQDILPSAPVRPRTSKPLPDIEVPKELNPLRNRTGQVEVTRHPKLTDVKLPDSIKPSDSPILKAGQAKPVFKDISTVESNLASPHTVLLSHPETFNVADPIVKAFDKKQIWIRKQLDRASPFIKGLSKSTRESLGRALDSGEINSLSPELKFKAQRLKSLFDDIHQEFPELPGDKKVGYIENYFTHMAEKEKQPGAVKSTFNMFKRDEIKTPVKVPNELGDLYEKGLGKPDSPYTKERTGNLRDINYDIKSVLPDYLESVSKVIFDKPAVDIAKNALKAVPEGTKLKDLAGWYIKNYTRYDSETALHQAFNSFASKAANTTARSFIDFNPGLHALHLGEIPVNIWPELGTKYTAYGIKQVATNPIKTWRETAKLGLIQGELKPFTFKTAGERWQSAAYFLNAVERFVKGTGYVGAKKMFLDKGLSNAEASTKALELTKNMTLDTGPARQMKGLSPESNLMGGEIGSKLGMQFKGVPAKIAEQMVRVAANAKSNPKAAARMLAGSAAMIYATKQGAHTFHLDPSSLVKTSTMGAFGSAMANVTAAVYRGDYETALTDLIAWAIPGGQAAKKTYNKVTGKDERDKVNQATHIQETKFGSSPLNSPKRLYERFLK